MIAISLSEARTGAGIIAIIALIWLIYLLGLKRYQSRSYKQQTGSLNSQKSISRSTEALLPLQQQVERSNISSFALSRNLLQSELSRIDELPGHEFERYVANLLEALGYSTAVTSRSNDYGVDVIAEKSGSRYAIQVKRHEGKVSRRAVSDAVAGQHHYNCDLAMVITNNYFQEGAIQLAKSTNCTLVDRDTLIEWIQQAQTGKSFFDILDDHEEEGDSNKIQLSGIADKTIVIEQIAARAHKYLYDKLRQYLSKGTQVTIIYPIIRTSYYMQRELAVFQQVFPNNILAMIDENTSYDETDKITQNFILGKIHILITRDITAKIQQTPTLCVIVVDNAGEFTEPELSKFCNVLANKSGKKYFCMLT